MISVFSLLFARFSGERYVALGPLVLCGVLNGGVCWSSLLFPFDDSGVISSVFKAFYYFCAFINEISFAFDPFYFVQ